MYWESPLAFKTCCRESHYISNLLFIKALNCFKVLFRHLARDQMVLEMDSGHEAARRNNPNKLCCGCDRSHHPGMFWEDKGRGNTSSWSSRMRKCRHPKAWRKAIRNKAALPIKYFHLDPPVLAPYQPFLVLFPEILLRFQSTLPFIDVCFPPPSFSSHSPGPEKVLLVWQGWHVCIFIKRASYNSMEFTLHKEIFFANTRISNMDINQLLKFNIFF